MNRCRHCRLARDSHVQTRAKGGVLLCPRGPLGAFAPTRSGTVGRGGKVKMAPGPGGNHGIARALLEIRTRLRAVLAGSR